MKQNRHQVEPDVEFHASIVKSVEFAFIRRELFRIGLLEGEEEGRDQQRQTDQACDPDKDDKWKVILQDAGHRPYLFLRLLTAADSLIGIILRLSAAQQRAQDKQS